MSGAALVRPNVGRRTLVLGLGWLGAYFAARALLESASVESWQRIAVAAAPVPLFAGFLWLYVGVIRSLDVLEREIHLEALAIAFFLALLLLMTLALLQRAISLSSDDFGYVHAWFSLPLFYFGGIGIASRRYREAANEE